MRVFSALFCFLFLLMETHSSLTAHPRHLFRFYAMNEIQSSLSGPRSYIRPIPVQRRHFSQESDNDYPKGQYVRPTEDIIFKHLMHDDEVRNSFLGTIIGEEIYSSQLLDTSLNPIRHYQTLRRVIEKLPLLAEKVQQGSKKIRIIDPSKNRPSHSDEKLIEHLLSHHEDLKLAVPEIERDTQLDVLCKTNKGLVNIEVQVEPQNYWDIRILSHVCGLFHRQFTKGFRWKSLEKDPDISEKIQRVIGVSLFEKAPRYPEKVKEHIPWYSMKPWDKRELRRHYTLQEKHDTSSEMGGIEFFHYNLSALKHLDTEDILKEGGIALKEWLDLLASAPEKTKQAIEESITMDPVKKAYKLIETNTLPSSIKEKYENIMDYRQSISHFVEGVAEEKLKEGQRIGIEKGKRLAKIKMVQNLLVQNIDIKVISQATGFSEEEIEKIRSDG